MFWEGGGPEERVEGGKNIEWMPCGSLEPKWQQAQDFKRLPKDSETSLKFGIQIFITRLGINPPPNPGAEIGKGWAAIVMATIFELLFVFYNNC